MSAKSDDLFPRRDTRPLKIGGVQIGGGAPIIVQSMTKTDTRDIKATVSQIRRMERAGCELIRLAVPDAEAAAALRDIKAKSRVPLIADIHFNPKLALLALEAGVDALRINPGTVGSPAKVRDVVRAAQERNAVLRIGVNSGSLEGDLLRKYGGVTAEAMVESALRHIRMLEDLHFFSIKVSLKASDVPRTVQAYRLLAGQVDYPFHAGITEAGGWFAGSVKSAAGLGILLREGLADTIRISLTASPEREVAVAYRILQSLRLRFRGVDIVSCPTCGRCEVDLMQIASRIEKRLSGRIVVPLTVAVMGCAVNGPGEAREADIGIACGRAGGVIFKEGRVFRKVKEQDLVERFVDEVEKLAAERRPPTRTEPPASPRAKNRTA